MVDPNIVQKELKNNKSRHPPGFPNELFKPVNAGEDLNIITEHDEWNKKEPKQLR